MRITTIDMTADTPEICDIEVVVRRLVASEDRLLAAGWRKLLDLVEFLRAEGPHPEVNGLAFGEELSLSPCNEENRVNVRVWADWQDYAPGLNGLPVMHYRFQIQREGVKLSQDARATTPQEAGRIVHDAFGWSS